VKSRNKVLLAAVISALASQANAEIITPKINVITNTPLPSIGLPLNLIPSNIQSVKRQDITDQVGVSIADYMINNMTSVGVNENQSNPWQPDINFRGFTASPLLGTPQGMSVFLDGVRVNEPFGDVVSWDMIPTFAMQDMQLIPGSNPIFGLNTLGGAIAIQTKSGRNNRGAGLEFEAGSWQRKRALAEYGGVSKDGSVDYYMGYQNTDEEGWRKFSPSHLNQLFLKTGWQNEKSKVDVSFVGAKNSLTGNGLVPLNWPYESSNTGYSSPTDMTDINTYPDITGNKKQQLTLNASHWLNDNTMFSGNAYFSNTRKKSYNADANDDFTELGVASIGGGVYACASVGAGGTYLSTYSNSQADECAYGVANRTTTKQKHYGFNMQLAFDQDLFKKKNQFIVGAGFEMSRIKFDQTAQLTEVNTNGTIQAGFDSNRGLINLDENIDDVHKLKSTTKTYSLFATDTLSLNEKWHINAGARYNNTTVKSVDGLNAAGSSDDIGGNHHYSRLNPTLGLVHTPQQNLSMFASYSEATRAPTSMELACANPENPCQLPNAMASDPHLKQVVAKTFEMGARGQLMENVKWNTTIYRTMNHDDIQFIASNVTGSGYFNNVGKTKRQGLEIGLMGDIGKFRWNAGYSYIDATYQTAMELVSESNSSASDRGEINIAKGDKIPLIPEHQLKLRGQYNFTPQWTVGANLIAFSDQYVRGNENNAHQTGSIQEDVSFDKGKIPGYSIVNLDTNFNAGNGWKLFAKVNNIFDKQYYTSGMLGSTHFIDGASREWSVENFGATFVSPGAPRAGWIGVRYEFGGEKNN
jgi:outer membrane receptor protein involved in Fe transport